MARRFSILSIIVFSFSKLYKWYFVCSTSNKICEFLEKFWMSTTMQGLPLWFLVALKHHVFENIHEIIDSSCVNLRMTIGVSAYKIPRRICFWRLLSYITRIPGHIDYCESSYGVIFLPKMKLDEHVCLILGWHESILRGF